MPTTKLGYDSEVSNYLDSDLFSFPVNPKTMRVTLRTQREIKEIPYSRFHLLTDRGGIKPRGFILSGFMNGSSKETNMQALAKKIFELDNTGSGLLRLYIHSDRFYYAFGADLQHDFNAGRTNFIDYIATLFSPVPFAYSDTGRSAAWSLATASATTINSTNDNGTGDGMFLNSGNAPAHVLNWSVTNNSANNITSVQIGDNPASAGNVQGNKITWTGTLSPGSTLIIYLFKVVEGTFKMLYYSVSGTVTGSRDLSSTSGTAVTEPPNITAGATNQNFSVKVTNSSGTPNYLLSAVWRDAYWL